MGFSGCTDRFRDVTAACSAMRNHAGALNGLRGLIPRIGSNDFADR
jgi:hypothetical protein